MRLDELLRRGDAYVDRGIDATGRRLATMPPGVFDILVVLLGAGAMVYLFVTKDAFYAVGFVVVLFAVLALMRRPEMLSYALFALIPISWLNLLGHSLRVITVLTAIGVVYHGSRFILMRERPRYNPVYLAYVLYLISCLFSLVNSSEILGASWPGTKYFLLALALLTVLTTSIRTTRDLRVLLVILLVWGVAESALGMLQTFVSPRFFSSATEMSIVSAYSVGGVRRAAGTFQIGPRFAMYLLAPLAVVVAGLFSGKVLSRRAWAVLLVPFIFGVFVSLTRIAVVLGFLYVPLYTIVARRRRALLTSVAGLVVVLVLVSAVSLAVPDDVQHALTQRFTERDDEVYMDRFSFLWNALGAFTEHPFLGMGVGTYELHSWEFMNKYPVPWRSYAWDVAKEGNMPETVPVHNEYGRMLAEQGVFALAIFIYLLIAGLRNLLYAARHTKDDLVRLLAQGMAVYLASLSVYWFFHEYFLEEPYTSIMPFAMSVILYNMTRAEVEAGGGEAA